MSKVASLLSSSLMVLRRNYSESDCFRRIPQLGKDVWIYKAGDALPENEETVLEVSTGDWISAQDIVLGFQRLRDIEFRKLHLSPREKEVAAFLLDGDSNARIAKTMYLTQAAVKYHVRNVFKKSGSSSREELFRFMKGRMEHSDHMWFDLTDYVTDIYGLKAQ